MAEIGLFETIHSARALRRFRPDPIPDEIITKVLDAAIRAPSAGDSQHWSFIVVRDPEQRRKIGAIYSKASKVIGWFYTGSERPAHMDEVQFRRFINSGTYLWEHMHEAPILLVACLRPRARSADGMPPELLTQYRKAIPDLARMDGASIYPAVQNIILACRALGLGTVLTTNHVVYEDELKALLGIPAEVHTYALMPIGYPRGKFGPVKRRPVNEVAHLDRWSNYWPG
ncbi:MAG TPA: nitroreductase family protein [Candidatus Binataceae bacterium]|nr:nitroreductase family protein [Candidatus Binataceae bacterium]